MRFWKLHAKVSLKAKLNFVPQQYKFWDATWVIWEVKDSMGTWEEPVGYEVMFSCERQIRKISPPHTNVLTSLHPRRCGSICRGRDCNLSSTVSCPTATGQWLQPVSDCSQRGNLGCRCLVFVCTLQSQFGHCQATAFPFLLTASGERTFWKKRRNITI